MSIEISHSGEVVMASAQMSPRIIGEGHTALMRAALAAAINMHAATVEALLDHGGGVYARAGDGGTALVLAADRGYTANVRLLKQAGAIDERVMIG